MRKIILALFLLTFHALSFSQEKTKKISIEFNNTDLKSALENIEKNTDYKFYFDQNWFKNETIIINKKYENTSIEDILTSIFEKTDLNYFISEKEIILTKNSIIYDVLPDDYFEPSTTAQPNK